MGFWYISYIFLNLHSHPRFSIYKNVQVLLALMNTSKPYLDYEETWQLILIFTCRKFLGKMTIYCSVRYKKKRFLEFWRGHFFSLFSALSEKVNEDSQIFWSLKQFQKERRKFVDCVMILQNQSSATSHRRQFLVNFCQDFSRWWSIYMYKVDVVFPFSFLQQLYIGLHQVNTNILTSKSWKRRSSKPIMS